MDARRLDDSRDLELLKKLQQARKNMLDQIGRRIIGQVDVIENLVCAILAGGHVIIVGVPGLAKTLLIQTLSEAMDLAISRVQFTPDLMPGDITGTELLEEDHATGRRVFKFVKGPVFANVVLADEINRAPPKTQSALLQAMQERTVTVAGQTHRLPSPFFVLATQNPIENIVTSEKAVEQAKENLRITQEQYKEQVATQTDVLIAQTLLTQTETNYYNSLFDFKIAQAVLFRAIGQETLE